MMDPITTSTVQEPLTTEVSDEEALRLWTYQAILEGRLQPDLSVVHVELTNSDFKEKKVDYLWKFLIYRGDSLVGRAGFYYSDDKRMLLVVSDKDLLKEAK